MPCPRRASDWLGIVMWPPCGFTRNGKGRGTQTSSNFGCCNTRVLSILNMGDFPKEWVMCEEEVGVGGWKSWTTDVHFSVHLPPRQKALYPRCLVPGTQQVFNRIFLKKLQSRWSLSFKDSTHAERLVLALSGMQMDIENSTNQFFKILQSGSETGAYSDLSIYICTMCDRHPIESRDTSIHALGEDMWNSVLLPL